MITKLFWANWHRDLGELAMDVLGPHADLAEPEPGYELTRAPAAVPLHPVRHHLRRRSNEIQRNIIGERALGLPPEPRA